MTKSEIECVDKSVLTRPNKAFPIKKEVLMQTFLYNPYRVELRTNPNSRNIVYAVMDHSDTNEVWQLLKESGTALASITGVDWNRELSPWKVP